MIGDRIGSYRIIRPIGTGGMGEVFEAVHEEIKRRAAIKVLHPVYSSNPDICQRLFNEALAVNVIEHPGIVGIFEFGRLPSGVAFIVMEYLDGQSLSRRLSEGGPLPELEALRLCRQIASALTAAHDKNIIHRDLKSDNVMLVLDAEAPGQVRAKVLDFGIAKVAEEHQVHIVRTSEGALMGTPRYMAPEQWLSSRDVDVKVDVYALGVMLYEMLSGRYPFTAGNAQQWMRCHLYEEPRRLLDVAPAVSPSLAELVHKMLNKTRGGRPTMRDVLARIDQLLRAPAPAWAAPTVQGRPRVPLPMLPQATIIVPPPSSTSQIWPRRLQLAAVIGMIFISVSAMVWLLLR